MKHIKYFGKMILAAITALILLCGLFTFYYNSPVYGDSYFGNTDFNPPPNSLWIQAVQGISWGRFDSQGFNNPETVEDPNILILGSSHMEATYIRQDQLLSVQLQQLLGPEARVYNMGISGCNLLKCLQYLPRTLEIYDTPPRLLIIETSGVSMTQEDVQQVLNASVPSIYSPKPQWAKPILGLPYFRQLARQKNVGLPDLLMPAGRPFFPEPAIRPDPNSDSNPDPIDPDVYEPLFQFIQSHTQPLNVQVLFFYHPAALLQPDGSAQFTADPMLDVFQEKCQEYGMGFLDMTEKFSTMYEQDHLLPHGFITDRIGEGHLNAHGHRAIAEEIADWIRMKEES